MKNLYWCTLSLLIYWLFSCSPKNDPVKSDPVKSDPTCRVGKIIQKNTTPDFPNPEDVEYGGKTYRVGTNAVTQFQYNKQSEITQATFEFSLPPATSNKRYTYEYFPAEIKETRHHPNGSQSVYTYMLNSQGYISSGNDHVYRYDSNGFLIYDSVKGIVVTNTIENGNIVRSQMSSVSADFKSESEMQYEFDLTKPGFPEGLANGYVSIDFGDFYKALTRYLGKSSKNLLKKSISKGYTKFSDGSEMENTRIEQYTYRYDDKGKIIRIIIDSELVAKGATTNLPILVFDFEYECL